MLNLLHYVVDLFFPSVCIYCEKPIKYDDYNLCNNCLNSIEYIEEKCERCSGILDKGKCTICSNREFFIKRNISIAEYTGVLKELLHNLKFNKKRRLYKRLSEIAYPEIKENDFELDLLTSVPMNKSNEWERGFNQSELISKELSLRLGLPYKKLLKENRNSTAQKELGYRGRFINVLNKYEVKDRSYVQGKKILIVDDVLTTGATINECARVLLKSGAVEINSLTIARANINLFK